MASRGKKKTTFAKLNRETKLRERRAEKEARKQARRLGVGGGRRDGGQRSSSRRCPQTSSRRCPLAPLETVRADRGLIRGRRRRRRAHARPTALFSDARVWLRGARDSATFMAE